MRFAFVAAALFASAGVACSLLLDGDGFATPPDPKPDADASSEDSGGNDGGDGGGIDAAIDPAAEIGNGSGRGGPLFVTVETTLNSYAALIADAPASATEIEIDSAPGWSTDDVVLLWETTGLAASSSGPTATVDLAPTPVGRYELARITKMAPKGAGIAITIGRPLVNVYRAGAAQVVRVPEHTDISIGPSGGVRAAPWDGVRGGIVALLATGKVQVDGSIDVDGRGFRGGVGHRNTNFSQCPDLDGFPKDGYAAKGEGLTPLGYSTPPSSGDARGGRGAVSNGGGGGNCHNAGGGGGGSGGEGGKGGRAYLTSSSADVGGFGGSSVIAPIGERIVLGGGGGAGDSEDSAGETTLAGAPGGGAIFVRAANILAPGIVSARGVTAGNGDANGGGGGGAGGTIILRAAIRISCGVAMSAAGGKGSTLSGDAVGPGGGGGGGRVFLQAPMVECTPSVAAGAAGLGVNPDGGSFGPSYGATDGKPGNVVSAP